MNVVVLVGHLGEDAKVVNLENDNVLVKLLLATRSQTNADGKADWHNVVVKGKLAHTCKPLKKGMKIAVNGHLHTHSWVDKNSGEKKYSVEIVAEKVEFHSSLNPKKEESTQSNGEE